MTQNFVLAHERRRRDLRDHEARVKTASRGQKRGEPRRKRGVHELLDAALADVRELRARDRRKVERERERLSVKIPAADQIRFGVVAHEHARVVGDAVHFAFEDGAHEPERVARCAVNLRNAAKRIRILHAAAVCAWLLHDLCCRPRARENSRRRLLAPDAAGPRADARRTGAQIL